MGSGAGCPVGDGHPGQESPVSPEPSLLEAFQRIGPRLGGDDDRVREAAARRLLDELDALKRRMRFDPTILEDAVQEVLKNLLCVGPRGARSTDPATDEAVGHFLRASLKNAAIDLLRRQRRLTPLPTGDLPNPGPNPDEVLESQERQRLLKTARKEVHDTIIPAIAADMDSEAGARFYEALGELREIAEGRRTFNDVVEKERVSSPSVDIATARNRLYKRFGRALAKVFDAIDALAHREPISVERREALRVVVHEFRLRRKQ